MRSARIACLLLVGITLSTYALDNAHATTAPSILVHANNDVNDYSVNAFPVSGAPNGFVAGKLNQAANFTSDQSIQYTGSSALGAPSDFTLFAWFNTTSIPNNVSNQYDFWAMDSGNINLFVDSNGRIAGGIVGQGRVGNQGILCGGVSCIDGHWHLAVFRHNSASPNINTFCADDVCVGVNVGPPVGFGGSNWNYGRLQADLYMRGYLDESGVIYADIGQSGVDQLWNGGAGCELDPTGACASSGVPSSQLVPNQGNPVGSTPEPINTANGNYYFQHSDFTIPGRGMPLIFQRSYNALDSYSGPLGANWTHSYNILLTASTNGATIKWGDGHSETFKLTGGNYVPPPGVFSTLVQNVDGTFDLTRKDQTQFLFSAAGVLTSIHDKNGNTMLLAYNGAGNLTQITDTVGRALLLSYDGSNRVAQITDALGRSVSYQYDVNNNLVQVVDTSGGTTTFAYDPNHRVTSITQPNGQILLQNVYDSSGRVVSQTNGRGVTWTLAYGTPNPTDTTITDGRGNNTIHTYDSSPRIVKVTDPLGGTTSFTYDANNDRTSVTNQNGKTTTFSYDGMGNVTGISDPLGHASAFTYDSKNSLLTATNPKGNATTFSYDGNGNLKTIVDSLGNTTTFSYDGSGELVSKKDARGNTTAYSYDSQANLTRITDPLSHSSILAYDGIGRLNSITDPNGHTATASYDALSRLVKIADPLNNQTQFAYDALGNLLKITDANGHLTSYAYDATNNLVTVTDALRHVTRYAYDPNNNRVGFINARGNGTSYVYDALNRLSRITDPLSFATSYSSDAIGNVLATTDAKGQANQFAYDALNRILTIAYADGKNVAYSYDADGNRLSMGDSYGTTTYAYDALDRVTSITHPGGKVVAYSYDAVGNRKSLGYPDGKVVTYSFDPVNRPAGVSDWLGRNTTYSYDAASNLTRTSYPNGAAISFAYDAANRLSAVLNSFGKTKRTGGDDSDRESLTSNFYYVLDSVGNRVQLSGSQGSTTLYGYDSLNELVSVRREGEGDKEGPDKGDPIRFTYDEVGNRQTMTDDDKTLRYAYDAADRLLSAGLATFTYDANGNQTSISRGLGSLPIIYQYDAANRLIGATGGRKTSSFAYDGDGNRITQSVGSGTYSYLNDVATSLPVVLQESGPDGNISYAYGLGLISESSPSFNYFYHYDGLGSVIALTDASGRPSAAYAYDPWGNPLLSIPDSVGTKNKFRFTGEALDPGTQLYYLRARYYDPASGRFLGRDPLSGNTHIPASLNRYVYAFSDPLRFSDPRGLAAQDGSTQAYTDSLTMFQLPNTAANPEFGPVPGSLPNEIKICNGITDCVTYALSAVSTVVPGKLALDAISFSASAATDINNGRLSITSKAFQTTIDALPLVVGLFNPVAGAVVGVGLFTYDTVTRLATQGGGSNPNSATQSAGNATTPAVAQPTGPLYLYLPK